MLQNIAVILAIAIAWLLSNRFAKDPWRGRLSTVCKAAITAGAFYILLSHPVKMEDGSRVVAGRLVLDTLASVDHFTFWTFCLASAGVKFVGILASMYRWVVLLRGQGIELPFRHVFGSFLIGRFIGTFLPSTAGLDGYTLYDAARFSGRTVEVTAAKALEKVIGISGIFLTFLVALPAGVAMFHSVFGNERGDRIAVVATVVCAAVVGALLFVLFVPQVVQWIIERLPLPGKKQLEALIMRISHSAAAYRDKKGLVALAFALSFVVHFTTAAMYFFTTLAIGAGGAHFWPIVLASSIQILATVLSPFTIAGEGIRELIQLVLLQNMIGAGPAIVSAALGFWAAEALTLFGGVFWWIRPASYTPAWCRVDGVQVDWAEAARAAADLQIGKHEDGTAIEDAPPVPPLLARIAHNAGLGFGGGVVAGLLIGVVETLVIAHGGFGEDAQVLWYGPFAYAAALGALGAAGGAVLGLLPMSRDEAQGWTPSLAMIATLVPVGLAITVFRLRRDVYLEQMPPLPVLAGVLVAFGGIALALFLGGRRIFTGPLGRLVRPGGAAAAMAVVVGLGFASEAVFGPHAAAKPGGAGVPAHLAERPNLVLVMVDTLRADHLDCYGASDVATPHLCAVARDGGTIFNAFSHASWTKPSTASLVTSLLPSTHNGMSKPSRLSDDIVFVSEVLQEHGYATGGIVSNINLAPSFGFDQGFDEYRYLAPDYLIGAKESSSKTILYQIARKVILKLRAGTLRFNDFYQDSQVVNAVAFDWLERHAKDRFYLFLHYMDPHDPYFAHPYDGTGIARVAGDPPAGEAARMRELYKGEIEYLDASFGRLLDRLKELGVYDDTLIVLTADHGEEFHEHGGFWHGLTLYDEQIRVPLLVKWPKGRAALPYDETAGLARSIDVAPTLIASAGAAVPDAMQGIDLAVRFDARNEKDREVFSEEDHEGNVLWSLRTRDMKLIHANEGNPRGVPPRELFDVANDPHETVNLVERGHADVEARLAQNAELQRQAAQGKAFQPGETKAMTRAECEQLRVLGYVDDCDHIPN
ncbi:MAG: sulfatase-like hydrolase/transferase [Myxococcales bacterium]|nr:sulfatase-like hydrolase/transferase [Myxococcales bacterium]